MDVNTGLHRLARVIRWTGRALAFAIVGLAALAAAARAPDSANVGAFFLVAGLLVAAIAESIEWVIEGFSLP